MQLQGCDLVGTMELWRDSSHDWNAAMDGYMLFRKDRLGRKGDGVALYVRGQLECLEFCLGMDDEPTESLCIRIKEQTNTGDIVVAVCCRLPDQQKQVDEALTTESSFSFTGPDARGGL